jgi:hypothetical protein
MVRFGLIADRSIAQQRVLYILKPFEQAAPTGSSPRSLDAAARPVEPAVRCERKVKGWLDSRNAGRICRW